MGQGHPETAWDFRLGEALRLFFQEETICAG